MLSLKRRKSLKKRKDKMEINFSYINNKGKLVCIEKYEPFTLIDNADTFTRLEKLRTDFGFKKKEFSTILCMYACIRFTAHTTSSYMDEGTIKQLSSSFMEPIKKDDTPLWALRPKVRYMFRLSEKGVELYNTLDALLQVEDGKEDAAFKFITECIK